MISNVLSFDQLTSTIAWNTFIEDFRKPRLYFQACFEEDQPAPGYDRSVGAISELKKDLVDSTHRSNLNTSIVEGSLGPSIKDRIASFFSAVEGQAEGEKNA